MLINSKLKSLSQTSFENYPEDGIIVSYIDTVDTEGSKVMGKYDICLVTLKRREENLCPDSPFTVYMFIKHRDGKLTLCFNVDALPRYDLGFVPNHTSTTVC